MGYTRGGVPFVTGSDTSEAAAEGVAVRVPALRARIMALFELHTEGLTCDDVEALTGKRHQTVSARIRELVQAARIFDTGARRVTRSGASARVYCAFVGL